MKHQKKKIKMCVTPKNTSKFNHPFGGPFPMKYQKVAINGILLLWKKILPLDLVIGN